MSIQRLEPEELLGVLQAHAVEFVIIGGFSLAAHGVVRGTKDIDIVPDPSEANLERLATALAALNATIDIGDIDAGELAVGLDHGTLAAGGNFRLVTRFGALDVRQDLPGMRGYEDLRATAIEVPLAGVPGPLRFAGYHALIALKSAAGRDQDVIDIADLRRARGEGD